MNKKLLIALFALAIGSSLNAMSLIDAIKNSDVTAAKKILNDDTTDKSIVHQQDAKGKTALHWAVHKNNAEVVQLLFECGANPNIITNDGSTPLAVAAKYRVDSLYSYGLNNYATIIQLLFAYEANPNIANNDGETPLYVAAFYNNRNIVQALLKHGANTTIHTNDGRTALAVTTRNTGFDIPYQINRTAPLYQNSDKAITTLSNNGLSKKQQRWLFTILINTCNTDDLTRIYTLAQQHNCLDRILKPYTLTKDAYQKLICGKVISKPGILIKYIGHGWYEAPFIKETCSSKKPIVYAKILSAMATQQMKTNMLENTTCTDIVIYTQKN